MQILRKFCNKNIAHYSLLTKVYTRRVLFFFKDEQPFSFLSRGRLYECFEGLWFMSESNKNSRTLSFHLSNKWKKHWMTNERLFSWTLRTPSLRVMMEKKHYVLSQEGCSNKNKAIKIKQHKINSFFLSLENTFTLMRVNLLYQQGFLCVPDGAFTVRFLFRKNKTLYYWF